MLRIIKEVGYLTYITGEVRSTQCRSSAQDTGAAITNATTQKFVNAGVEKTIYHIGTYFRCHAQSIWFE